MLKERPEETISFNEKMDSMKSDDAIDKNKNVTTDIKNQSQLIDQINSYIAKDNLDS